MGEEGERGARADAEHHPLGIAIGVGGVGVAARQGVSHSVEVRWTILHREVQAKELVDPLMLRHRRQPLVQEELEAVVVRANPERATPEVGPPMAHGLHQADELLLVHRKLEVTGGKGPAEVGEGTVALVKDGAEPCTGSVAVDDERSVEVQYL
jgi:hypothetical protein